MTTDKKMKKIYVLDTSVILHDHSIFTSFGKDNVAVPISVLEELDTFKKGNDNINFEAREFLRKIDDLSTGATLQDWIPIRGKELGKFCVVMSEKKAKPDACAVFGEDKADNRILNVAIQLQTRYRKRQVVLVSKDINLRIKAKSLSIHTQGYQTENYRPVNTRYKGRTTITDIPTAVIDKIYQQGSCHYTEVLDDRPTPNHYFIIKNESSSVLAYFNADTDQIEHIHKTTCYGIKPRNAEQVFAMHALLNDKVKLVTISGVAGTGKTLLALSSAIEQRRDFHQIYLARPIIPLSNKDIGFLPGDIKSKLNPYMEPLFDNLKTIQNQFRETDKNYQRIKDMQEREKLVINPLAYIRGRSLSNIIFIVDEAQNLTPHEVKTIITRAGENTKIIFTGDVHQIDTPYLDTQSNGLAYLIDRIKSHELHAHVTLEKGERSELANIANDLL
ncbi:MAG: PhoH family protein [Cytophagales bacterium]|nr:PhoH family protein [Cytophagales bacterium]